VLGKGKKFFLFETEKGGKICSSARIKGPFANRKKRGEKDTPSNCGEGKGGTFNEIGGKERRGPVATLRASTSLFLGTAGVASVKEGRAPIKKEKTPLKL